MIENSLKSHTQLQKNKWLKVEIKKMTAILKMHLQSRK